MVENGIAGRLLLHTGICWQIATGHRLLRLPACMAPDRVGTPLERRSRRSFSKKQALEVQLKCYPYRERGTECSTQSLGLSAWLGLLADGRVGMYTRHTLLARRKRGLVRGGAVCTVIRLVVRTTRLCGCSGQDVGGNGKTCDEASDFDKDLGLVANVQCIVNQDCPNNALCAKVSKLCLDIRLPGCPYSDITGSLEGAVPLPLVVTLSLSADSLLLPGGVSPRQLMTPKLHLGTAVRLPCRDLPSSRDNTTEDIILEHTHLASSRSLASDPTCKQAIRSLACERVAPRIWVVLLISVCI